MLRRGLWGASGSRHESLQECGHQGPPRWAPLQFRSTRSHHYHHHRCHPSLNLNYLPSAACLMHYLIDSFCVPADQGSGKLIYLPRVTWLISYRSKFCTQVPVLKLLSFCVYVFPSALSRDLLGKQSAPETVLFYLIEKSKGDNHQVGRQTLRYQKMFSKQRETQRALEISWKSVDFPPPKKTFLSMLSGMFILKQRQTDYSCIQESALELSFLPLSFQPKASLAWSSHTTLKLTEPLCKQVGSDRGMSRGWLGIWEVCGWVDNRREVRREFIF